MRFSGTPKKNIQKKHRKRKKRMAFRGTPIVLSKKQKREIQKRGRDFADPDEFFSHK